VRHDPPLPTNFRGGSRLSRTGAVQLHDWCVPLARQGWLARLPPLQHCVVSSQSSHFGFESEDVIDAEPVVAGMPQLAEGTELIGEYQGSGFHERRYILRRADGQVIQLPRLSYLLASILDGRRDLEQVAMLPSVEFGRGFRRNRCLI
jgi:hypothetical protein